MDVNQITKYYVSAIFYLFPVFYLQAKDVDNLISLTKAAGARLLYDLNLSFRYLSDWDANNALRLMKYMVSKGYGDNVDFELGNGKNSTL